MSKSITAFVIVVSIVIVALLHTAFLPTACDLSISVIAIPDAEYYYHEAWLTGLNVDAQDKPLNKVALDTLDGWVYSSESDDLVFYPTKSESNSNHLAFTVTGKKIQISFARNTWSGAVKIYTNDKMQETINLYSDNDSDDKVSCNIIVNREYTVLEYILYGTGASILVFFILSLFASIINMHKN